MKVELSAENLCCPFRPIQTKKICSYEEVTTTDFDVCLQRKCAAYINIDNDPTCLRLIQLKFDAGAIDY